MASALIAVQVALCAVIGFVTFGTGQHGRSGHPQADSLAGAPRLIPSAGAGMPSPPALDPSSAGTSTKRANPKSSAPRVSVAPNAGILVAPSPPPPKSSAPTLLLPGNAPSRPADTMAPSPRSTVPEATPSPTGSVQSGAVVDQTCNPLGALGRSRDGSVLICRPDTDGNLHWKTT
jgi:hypothetical protein